MPRSAQRWTRSPIVRPEDPPLSDAVEPVRPAASAEVAGPGADRSASDIRRAGLQADCERCAGLCCVAPAFSASADFAIDKPAGQPCPNLAPDFRCAIHARLRQAGFPGCAVYDCFGAGQKVTQLTLRGQDWRSDPQVAARVFGTFATLRALHELLWYLDEALTRVPAHPLRGELELALEETERLADAGPEVLAGLDLAAHHRYVNAVLVRASDLLRSAGERRTSERPSPAAGRENPRSADPGAPNPPRADLAGADIRGADLRGADLVGTSLRGADLRAASLRGARLVGADLSGCDLERADLTGADLRGARLDGARLAGSLFMTQAQLDAATGDATTTLPARLHRPGHWS